MATCEWLKCSITNNDFCFLYDLPTYLNGTRRAYDSQSVEMLSFMCKVWLISLSFLLKLVHFAYSVFEYFDLGWLLLKRKYAEVLDLRVLDSQLFVSEFVRKLDKRPSHFVVIVGENGVDVRDFSNIVIWCLAAKISFVSFYDYSGYLKANEHIYYNYLIEKRKIDPKCLIFDIDKLSTKNGVLHKIHLNILSLEDGKPLFVEMSKKLSQNVISNKLKIGEINERLISNELYKFSGLPEPDLVVVSGNTLGTFGLLPWQIRITEFLRVRSLNGIKVSEFTSLLLKYSSCTQRFGK